MNDQGPTRQHHRLATGKPLTPAPGGASVGAAQGGHVKKSGTSTGSGYAKGGAKTPC